MDRKMKLESDFRKKTIWTFNFKGIPCEIVNWSFESGNLPDYPTGNWNYYLYIKKENIPDEFNKLLVKQRKLSIFKEQKMWDYHSLSDYFDMHGDITYYEVIRNEFNGGKVAVKIGCDYLHSFDSDHYYDVEDIKRDVKASVNTFIEHFPYYLVWNIKDGSYIKPDFNDELSPTHKEGKDI